MPLTVIVGGQYGSEGKGKLSAYLACSDPAGVASVRSGGSNAGHTAHRGGVAYQLRQLPCGAVSAASRLYLAAGMVIDLPVLLREIGELGVECSRLMIDRNSVVMSQEDSAREITATLRERVGSTLSGTGAALARKVMRDPTVRRAADVPALNAVARIGDVSEALNLALDRGEHVVIEGTQGFGLSLHHTDHYPYATSRDTTAAAFLSDAGLSPGRVTDVVVVLRTFPIRVAGNSGPMHQEITWADVQQSSGYPTPLAEYTTVTKKLRRVGCFDWRLAEKAIRANHPTALALHGADYLDYADYGAHSWSSLGDVTRRFVDDLEQRLRVPVEYVFTGPGGEQLARRPTPAPGGGADGAGGEG